MKFFDLMKFITIIAIVLCPILKQLGKHVQINYHNLNIKQVHKLS